MQSFTFDCQFEVLLLKIKIREKENEKRILELIRFHCPSFCAQRFCGPCKNPPFPPPT